MEKPSLITIIIIICLLIIGLYAMGEVNYFSSKIAVERNIEAPKIIIPSIGVEERINNVSLSQGVYNDPTSYTPTLGEVILYGHRTLQGSPFLRLNELHHGDTLLLEWPGIGEMNYSVVDSKIVPATYEITTHEGEDDLYLITCDPIGSTENRLIVQGELNEKNPINNKILKNNPQESTAILISLAFLIGGTILSFLYPKENRVYLLFTVVIISAVLLYCCIHPIPSQLIYDKIIFLNGGI